jgi:putative oxidoreductase
MRPPFLLGRLLFGGYFIFSGIHHFQQKREMAQYAASKHVPKPDWAVQATGAMLIAGGTSILLGLKPKLGAAAIIGFLAGVSPVMHDFWKQQDPQQKMNEMVNFTKNLALVGAATALMGVDEPWPASIVPSRRRDHGPNVFCTKRLPLKEILINSGAGGAARLRKRTNHTLRRFFTVRSSG